LGGRIATIATRVFLPKLNDLLNDNGHHGLGGSRPMAPRALGFIDLVEKAPEQI